MSDRRVRHKCRVLFPQWEVTARTVHEMQCFILLSRETASHYKRVAEREALQAKHARKSHRSSSNSQSLTHSEENQPDGGAFGVYTGRSTHSSGDKRRSRGSHHSSTRSFDFKKEEKNIRESIASSNIASDNLMNALRLVNNQSQNVSENSDVSRRFKECKSLRRQMVRYIQNVTSEQYLGSLLKANENLVQAMENYDLMNKSADYSTDSEDGEYISSSAAPSSPPPARPPRPDHAAKPQFVNPPESESDEDDNPFGDRHAVHSPPSLDREGHSWLVNLLSSRRNVRTRANLYLSGLVDHSCFAMDLAPAPLVIDTLLASRVTTCHVSPCLASFTNNPVCFRMIMYYYHSFHAFPSFFLVPSPKSWASDLLR